MWVLMRKAAFEQCTADPLTLAGLLALAQRGLGSYHAEDRA
jgi:hypothetical protein